MTSTSRKDLENYGIARVRDIAFDAVHKLWSRRREAGVTQKDLSDRLGRDPSWVSRQFRGPGNWTFRSFGALVEALEGEVEIIVHPLEQPIESTNGYNAYEHSSRRGNDYRRNLVNAKDHSNKRVLRQAKRSRGRAGVRSFKNADTFIFVKEQEGRSHA